ncbi:hypothetical protein [Periweissella beninensis]|uniref:Uncharacterized protein n=1 Tax=Periweissella beninensis TaxID=504936 RepID=A0ABT0VMA1_9LACO|nr:hypothetical protein [Periweissella beninensis]MBM7544555.1 hypothetical protein [Periweissella beninensis]MCM2438054.1 hypothetical protein [Periweissella beninensis]MCT4395833.1 hypothetical protein [Periweissella beninensis]
MEETLDLIEEITRNDSSKYYEVGNLTHNGRAEAAVEKGFIKEVRILKLNIPHSKHVQIYEKYINETQKMPVWEMSSWDEWEKTPEMLAEIKIILADNKVG